MRSVTATVGQRIILVLDDVGNLGVSHAIHSDLAAVLRSLRTTVE